MTSNCQTNTKNLSCTTLSAPLTAEPSFRHLRTHATARFTVSEGFPRQSCTSSASSNHPMLVKSLGGGAAGGQAKNKNNDDTRWAVCQCSDSHCVENFNIHCRKGYNKAWKVKRKRNISFAAKLMCVTHSRGPRAVQDERLNNTRKRQIFSAQYAEHAVCFVCQASAGLWAWAHNVSL